MDILEVEGEASTEWTIVRKLVRNRVTIGATALFKNKKVPRDWRGIDPCLEHSSRLVA